MSAFCSPFWPELNLRPLAAALLCAFLMQGCGGTSWEEARQEAEDTASMLETFRPAAAGPRFSAIQVIERHPWLGLVREDHEPRPSLPARFLGPEAVTLPLSGVGEAGVLARRIEAATGLGVRFSGRVPADEAAPAAEGFGNTVIDGLVPEGGIWTGPLDALLDAWTAHAGYAWRFDGTGIEIVRHDVAVFRIHALAGTQRYAASATTDDEASGGGEAGDGGGVSTSQSIAAETEYDPWPEIEAQASAIVGPGATVAAAPSSASLLVTGRPRDVDRVRGFLSWLNREVLRPVTLSVHVYSVRRERETDYGLGIAAAVAEIFGTSAKLAVSPESVAVIRPTEALGDTLAATVRALRRTGTATRVLSADIPSLNGKPAQFFELYKEAYLKERRSTAGDGIAESELVPGTVSSGFAVSYVPRITGPGEVLVRLFASLRDRPTFREYGTADASIQLPAYATRAVQVSQRIGRGETLLVSGFSGSRAEAEGSGTFHEAFPLPGGGRRASLARTEQVLLVTASIGAPLGIAETGGHPGTGDQPGTGDLSTGPGERL
ncbi:MAG: hypothetical protein OXO52_17440 [Rhodospirillales bacterium]|nr:hypothetical protein [Rhodospirillales bacterium]MDE0379699.1 hypothetical protein [Rhodospirillales bacterium]